MSETTDRMTIREARKLLGDTRGVSSKRINEAETLLHELRLKKPGYLPGGGMCVVSCRSCGCSVWTLHTDGDDERWACDRCHREPMTNDEALALRAARREQEAILAAEAKAVADAAPKPREALKAVAAELAGARAEEARLEAAAAHARDQLAQARVALDVAEAELPAARTRAAEEAVTALLTGKTKPVKTFAAEESAVEAARSGLSLATTATDTLADMLTDVGYQVRRLEKAHRAAALAVLSDETAPLFVARATEARTEFVAASRGLQWLENAGVAPSSLIAAELRWSWNRLPDTWTSAGQSGPDLDGALKALLANSSAPVDLAWLMPFTQKQLRFTFNLADPRPSAR
jgi:hypothetical protein